jgi:hypothetical protein
MDYGTETQVQSAADAEAYVVSLKERHPVAKSAYVPSGKLPPAALVWLALGAAIGVPAGAATGAIVGGLALALTALVGALIALVAACGYVVCVTLPLFLVVSLGGALATAFAVGFVPAWIIAELGRRGKSRSPTAAALLALPSALFAFAIVFALPQLAAFALGPADPTSDFAPATIVAELATLDWMRIVAWVIALGVTLLSAWFMAVEFVGEHKFCEACEENMGDARLTPYALTVAPYVAEAIARGDVPAAAQSMRAGPGIDVAPTLFSCPKCGAGFFEAELHARMAWPDKNGKADRHDQWRCLSVATRPDQTAVLAQLRAQG